MFVRGVQGSFLETHVVIISSVLLRSISEKAFPCFFNSKLNYIHCTLFLKCFSESYKYFFVLLLKMHILITELKNMGGYLRFSPIFEISVFSHVS